MIVDTAGNVVWYLDPANDTGIDQRISGLSLSRPDHHIMAILGNEFVVEYTLTGELLKLYCRDQTGGGTSCLNSVAADAYFDEFHYVSHDVLKARDRIWVLNSSNRNAADPDHCDGGDTASPIIEDGVFGFDYSDDSLDTGDVDWAMSDAIAFNYDGDCGDGPGYWAGKLSGWDVTHANSLWIDDNDGMTISLDARSDIIYVDGELASGTYGDLIWTLAGDSVADDFTRTATGFDDDFGDQHNVFWTADATLMFLDNHRGTTNGYSRGVEMEVDFDYFSTTILKEYDMGVQNHSGGSAFDLLPSGNVLVTSPVDGEFTYFTEFDDTNSEVWSMTLECDPGSPTFCVRAAPSYRAIANPF